MQPSLPHSSNLPFIEQLYVRYLRDPGSVASDWRNYFEQFPESDGFRNKPRLGPSFRPASVFNPAPGGNGAVAARRAARPRAASTAREATPPAPPETREPEADRPRPAAAGLGLAGLQERVDLLIRNYRVRGHRVARVDPLGRRPPDIPELEPEYYGFRESVLDRPFSAKTIGGPRIQTLREILRRLRNTYCRSIGVQFMHIDDSDLRQWLQDRMEATENRIALSRQQQLGILRRLTHAVVFEEFLQKKYIGAKSFSLEGAETLIPLLDLAIEIAGEQRIDEIVLAMAHRGRLNVLANILGKRPHEVFREFEDIDPKLHVGRGDVKYHLGYSNDWKTAAGHTVHLSLCFNPSHLEFVNPVAVGRMRAKQDRHGDTRRERGMTLLIHGDAAFIGEGIVQETLNLSQLPGYAIGGTLHIIVNNQIGFTTGPEEARSSTYASDVAKMLQVPIFHVNGEDPEAVAQVVRLAMDFRRAFHRDVVIDMYCFRRRGHNEGDEPSFTQPVMYRRIDEHPSVRRRYLDHLLELGGVSREEADRMVKEHRDELERELQLARSREFVPRSQTLGGIWSGYLGGREDRAEDVDTGVERSRLAALLEAQTRLPQDFHPHPKIERGIEIRRAMARGEKPLDWAAAESLALATIATEGFRVRLSGQDTARGTFSQRHAVLYDYQTGRPYMPLRHLAPDQGPVEVWNSPLSEAGVLGFEYGYSLDCPDGLILWEAQFGDFSNAAQVIIDQFLASGEDKWHRLSGLVLLLPHGFEGQGPEHSSARLERFLMLAAEDNIQVVNPTTPAQYFHVLRRQVLRRWRKPLVVMTPKSLLRHPKAVSDLDQCAAGRFRRVLPDAGHRHRPDISRVLLCSGKVYYDLEARRRELQRDDVAILRLEQLYPLPFDELCAATAPYTDDTPVFWVQEEPENMGAWRFLRVRFGDKLCGRLPFAGLYRPASASPATGSAGSHKLEQDELLNEAFCAGHA